MTLTLLLSIYVTNAYRLSFGHLSFPKVFCSVEPSQQCYFPNWSHKCTVSLILITNICFQKHIVAANWSPCRRQTLRPAASWSQPAGSSNSVPTSCLSHTSTHSPSRQPAVHTWQTLLRLAKEDLYLVFDLLEFASILVKERAWLWGRERSQRSQVFLGCIRMMELANLMSNSCPLGCYRWCIAAQLKAVWKHGLHSTHTTS